MGNDCGQRFIPVYKPALDGREIEYVNACLESSWISSKGEFISRFESEFSKYLRVERSTTVANGTLALHLSLLALNIGPGDEVLVPTLTYVASANAVAYVGATPVFVEAEERTWNIDPARIVEKITHKTKAIVVVHLYGNPCAMDEIAAICRQHNLLIVEDVAEAFGSQFHGKYVGSFGDVSAFSFFGNKTITTGEGGMVVSNNLALMEKAANLKSQGVSQTREYWHDVIGYNFRMTNICAAIGLAQLERADAIIEKKIQIAEWYQEELQGCELTFPVTVDNTVSTWWMVSVLTKDERTRDSLRAFLREQAVETRPLFYPVHTMPVFKSNERFPVAESLSCRGLNLPSFPDLTRNDVSHITSLIRMYLHEKAD